MLNTCTNHLRPRLICFSARRGHQLSWTTFIQVQDLRFLGPHVTPRKAAICDGWSSYLPWYNRSRPPTQSITQFTRVPTVGGAALCKFFPPAQHNCLFQTSKHTCRSALSLRGLFQICKHIQGNSSPEHRTNFPPLPSSSWTQPGNPCVLLLLERFQKILSSAEDLNQRYYKWKPRVIFPKAIVSFQSTFKPYNLKQNIFIFSSVKVIVHDQSKLTKELLDVKICTRIGVKPSPHFLKCKLKKNFFQ